MKRLMLLSFLLVWVSLPLVMTGCEAGEAPPPVDSEPPPPPKPRPGEFVTIPAGEFKMGSDERPEKQKDKPQPYEPEHTIDLPAYEIGVYEVTNGEFARFQIESEYLAEGDWRSFYSIGQEDKPVANVTLDDAKAYCEWIGGRLPTEAEWEKAARGPEGNAFPWGNEFDYGKSQTNEAGANTVDVGQMEGDKSGYGLYDTLGNVTEWTSSDYKAYPDSPARRDPNFRKRYTVARGASYAIKGYAFKLWNRGAYLPKSQFGIGFRCVKDIETADN